MLYEKVLYIRLTVREAQAKVAHCAQPRTAVAEQPLHPIGGQTQRRNVLATLTLIPAQQVIVATISLRTPLRKYVRQLTRIAKTEIHALPGQRMHIVRSVSNEGKARPDKPRHALQPQRKSS